MISMQLFKTILMSLSVLAIAGCSSGNDDPEAPEPAPNPEEPGSVVFLDDFNSFNSAVWTKESHPAGWTNQELQAYSPSYVWVAKDGDKSVLVIAAEKKNGQITSGRVNSKGKKSFKYGKIEASIKLPSTANGLWPAFWMMGDNAKQWPACGEIDIMEMGDAEGIATGDWARRVNTAIHYGETAASHMQEYYAGKASQNLQDGSYHVYGMQWDESSIQISVDGKPFKTFDIKNNLYFQGNFYLLFNLAVGGTFTGITDVNAVTALQDGQRVYMYVDWIKVTK